MEKHHHNFRPDNPSPILPLIFVSCILVFIVALILSYKFLL